MSLTIHITSHNCIWVGLGWVLLRINHCRLSNAKSYLCTCIMVCKNILFTTFLNELGLFFLFCTQLNGFKYFNLIQIMLF